MLENRFEIFDMVNQEFLDCIFSLTELDEENCSKSSLSLLKNLIEFCVSNTINVKQIDDSGLLSYETEERINEMDDVSEEEYFIQFIEEIQNAYSNLKAYVDSIPEQDFSMCFEEPYSPTISLDFELENFF